MKILIDADGCPVVKQTIEIAKENRIEVIVFCDTSHIINSDYATVMAYINENVERLHSEKIQIQAEIQRLSENRYSANEKIICDFDKFDTLPFERKRELANAVIKKIYATSDKIDIIWNI